ncbi:MAG: CBS domain-containing protein [Flavobacteriaceae bacterium]|nr:CBS domain-containing protein [Flavobacteriaceae bacterium]
MGEQKVTLRENDTLQAQFIDHLLQDIKALEYMLEHDMIETGITRIGAEQEFCLVTKDWRPANNADAIMKQINDAHFTTELAKYNLEINLDPEELKEGCFEKVKNQLQTLLEKANEAAKQHDSKVVLTGILPTISQTHLRLNYITERPRYLALNKRLMEQRGSHFHLHLMGVDELSIRHDSVLFEACNTSFQLHLQIDPGDFISSFNWAQAIAGPVLSICTNSPMLLGRELWSETRIALFRQSIDTRHISLALKDQLPRVSFGTQWATGSIVDIYKENISQYKSVLTTEIDENSFEDVKQGNIPKLKALSLHNGTIYPWNRACYGVGEGKPHLRIENRYIPAGPSTLDEMANFVFWVGLMKGRPKEFNDMPKVMDFRDAKSNFIKAARYGNEAVLHWMGKDYTPKKLFKTVLLPLAEKGLQNIGLSKEESTFYLQLIEERIEAKGGSQWMVSNFRNLKNTLKTDQALRLLTKYTYKNQIEGIPISRWDAIPTKKVLKDFTLWVGHIMTTRLFTVKESDLALLATSIMEWKNIHHMPVENEEGELCGLLTWTHVKKMKSEELENYTTVKDIMVKNVITTTPTTPISGAIELMKENLIGCLPVIQHEELIGIITIKDLIAFDNA